MTAENKKEGKKSFFR